MSEKMMFVFTKEELARISTKEIKGRKIVMVDVHGMKVKEAKRFIKNIVAMDKEGNDLCVIHGYNHGIAIKRLITTEKLNERITDRRMFENNPGRTLLSVKAA